MTAYCLVASPGFSNCTCILGALPVGTASAGFTYSPGVSCERTIRAVIPINTSAQPSRFILLIALLLSSRIFTSRLLARPVVGPWFPQPINSIRTPVSRGLGSDGASCRRRHEFRSHRTSDRLPQNLIDCRQRIRAELPVLGARHSFQFFRMRAPQRRRDPGRFARRREFAAGSRHYLLSMIKTKIKGR